ncbi:MAG: GNAT family N-acetyltransferase [Anaerolineae bacterium]|nr:GNAT family N-acetyltransferase [Anaerolineae bacterium]
MSTSAVTRYLTAEDYDAIVALWQAAGLSTRPNGRDSRAAFEAQMARDVQTVVGLEAEGRLVGVAVATHDGRKGWINRLAVHPDCRRRGYARQLIAASERVLKEKHGVAVVGVLIEDWNEASLALFRQAGYVLHDDIHYLSKRDRADV